MSWIEARDQLTSVLEALTPANAGGSLSTNAFKNFPDGNAIRTRSFHWRLSEMSAISPTVTGRLNFGCTLIVAYQKDRSTEKTDATISLDYNSIIDALLNKADNWNVPTSTIEALQQGGDEIMLSSVRDEEDMRFLDIDFEMQVTT